MTYINAVASIILTLITIPLVVAFVVYAPAAVKIMIEDAKKIYRGKK